MGKTNLTCGKPKVMKVNRKNDIRVEISKTQTGR